jgi:YD repeat-containing protein
LTYQHDKNGNRVELTWPDAIKVWFDYDGLNRMKRVWEGAITVAVY